MSWICKIVIEDQQTAVKFCTDISNWRNYNFVDITYLDHEMIWSLLEIITNEKLSSESAQSKIPLVFGDSYSPSPWLYVIPGEIVQFLAGCKTKTAIRNLAKAWRDDCQLIENWSIASVAGLLTELQKASLKSLSLGKSLFLMIT